MPGIGIGLSFLIPAAKSLITRRPQGHGTAPGCPSSPQEPSCWLQGIPFWALNGIGLSFLIPTAQSLIADYNVSTQRGKAFGLLHFRGAVGAFLGALYATNIGAPRIGGTG